MKTRVLFVIVGIVLLAIGVFFFRYDRGEMPQTPPTVAEMVAEAKAKRQGAVGLMPLRPELVEVIKSDPDQAIVHFVLLHARRWPGILPIEEKQIAAKAQYDSSSALVDLERCVYDGVTRQMAKEGKDPTQENRRLWEDNNPATIWLFIDLPFVERLGRKREFITELLQGRKENDSWRDVIPEHYYSWSQRGIWPFLGESVPIYRYRAPRRV